MEVMVGNNNALANQFGNTAVILVAFGAMGLSND
jgi:hypothetical protein